MGCIFQTPLIIMIGFLIAGSGFAFIQTLAVVVLWELVPKEKRTGIYTSIYFLAIFMGAIVGPLIFGFLTEILGNVQLLLIVTIFIVGGLICMFFVKRGEAGDVEKQVSVSQ